MSVLKSYLALHDKIFGVSRRRAVACYIVTLLPQGPARVLDLGSGNGMLQSEIQRMRTDLTFTSVDVDAVPSRRSPLELYDGRTLPFEDCEFDWVLLADVLHHADDIPAVLSEAARVSRLGVVVKDHFVENRWDRLRLTLTEMSRNRIEGMRMPLNYMDAKGWMSSWSASGLAADMLIHPASVYGFPVDIIVGRHVQFVVRCIKS